MVIIVGWTVELVRRLTVDADTIGLDGPQYVRPVVQAGDDALYPRPVVVHLQRGRAAADAIDADPDIDVSSHQLSIGKLAPVDIDPILRH